MGWVGEEEEEDCKGWRGEEKGAQARVSLALV